MSATTLTGSRSQIRLRPVGEFRLAYATTAVALLLLVIGFLMASAPSAHVYDSGVSHVLRSWIEGPIHHPSETLDLGSGPGRCPSHPSYDPPLEFARGPRSPSELPSRFWHVPVATRGIGALDDASRAAFRAADNVSNFAIPTKHLPGSAGNYAKFADDIDPHAAIQQALRSENAMFLPNQLPGSFRVVTDLGYPIGSRGQTALRIIVGENGSVWNAFPVKSL